MFVVDLTSLSSTRCFTLEMCTEVWDPMGLMGLP